MSETAPTEALAPAPAPSPVAPVHAPPAPAPAPSPAGVGGFVHPVPVATLSGEAAAAELAHLQKPGSAYWDGDRATVARTLALRERIMAAEAEASPPPAPGAHEALSEREAMMKVSNSLSIPSVADASEAQEIRAGLTTAIAVLGLNHAESGHVILAMNDAMRKPIETTAAALETQLKRAWAESYPRYIAFARAALDRVEAARPGTRDFLERSGLGNSYVVVAAFAKAGQRMSRR